MADKEHKTLETGVKGTDNCPICGRTMTKLRAKVLVQEVWLLWCDGNDHHVQIILPKEK